ncbi:class III lanthipeptide [Deinococcus sp. QL22]|uniref:class III lanthipeptide n=1 Tax=Deinococcus sp. QL22 TaxID=2939437 RepID=UPI00201799A1|nr:class III lanthipeptide [Deinococcus sp. QL22]UQN09433.1 class III lanthipeptide [Deinococcus sp. QL22]
MNKILKLQSLSTTSLVEDTAAWSTSSYGCNTVGTDEWSTASNGCTRTQEVN